MADSRRIYVDLDDVLCETARGLAVLLHEHKGTLVPFETILSFDLGASFQLSPVELAAFMILAHEKNSLLSLEPVKGAHDIVHGWFARGIGVSIVTGRPPSTFRTSSDWLKMHRFPFTELTFVDKYSRPDVNSAETRAIPLQELILGDYVAAIEDSPAVVDFLIEHGGMPVILFDRPWNREYSPPPSRAGQLTRCTDWADVGRVVADILERSESI